MGSLYYIVSIQYFVNRVVVLDSSLFKLDHPYDTPILATTEVLTQCSLITLFRF